MKKLILCVLVLTGCSSIDVYPAKHFVDLSKELSKEDLVKESKAYYKKSGMDDFSPAKNESDKYYGSLADVIDYQKYLFLECAILLHKEYALELDKPVYVSIPKWDNVQNFYSIIFNFQSSVNNISTESTMECDLAMTKSKEVREYQLKKFHNKLVKNK